MSTPYGMIDTTAVLREDLNVVREQASQYSAWCDRAEKVLDRGSTSLPKPPKGLEVALDEENKFRAVRLCKHAPGDRRNRKGGKK